MNFDKNILKVFMGNISSQLTIILGSIVIVRIFAPAEFGEFSIWLAIVSFFSVTVTLRLENALPILEEEESKAQKVIMIATIILLLTILLALILTSLSYLGVKEFFLIKPHSLILLPPAVLFFSLNQVLQTWAMAEGAFSKLNIMRFFLAFNTVLIQIAAGYKFPTALSLISGFVLANAISFMISTRLMQVFSEDSAFDLSNIRSFFTKYYKLPLYALPADTINSIVSQLPLIIIFSRFGAEAAGYLALTLRVLGAPIALASKSVLDVFKYHAFQTINAIGNCRELYIKTFKRLLAASLLFVLCTIFLADDIFRLAFGVEWQQSARISILLLPMFALSIIASPLSYMSYLIEKPNIDLLWQISLLLTITTALYSFESYRLSLIAYAVTYALMYLVYLLISWRFSLGK
jgi:O-antigen/teichoic acid export membrane protein